MSDYVRKKVISYPINEEEICKKYNIDEIDELEYIDKFKDKFNYKNGFEIEGMVTYGNPGYPYTNYLEYILSYSYGDESGDFGRNRYLSEKEQEKYKPLFEEILGEIDSSKLKYIDYCWYNCCEPDDYYLKEDSFLNEV